MNEKDLPLPIPNNHEDLLLWLDFAGSDKFGVENILKAVENNSPLPDMGKMYSKVIFALTDNEPPQSKAELLTLLGALDQCIAYQPGRTGKSAYDRVGGGIFNTAAFSGRGDWVGCLITHLPETFIPMANSRSGEVNEMVKNGSLSDQAQLVLFGPQARLLSKIDQSHNIGSWRVGNSLMILDSILTRNPGALETIGRVEQIKLEEFFNEHSHRLGLTGGLEAFEMKKIREKKRKLEKQAGKMRVKVKVEGNKPAKPGPKM